VLNGPTICLRWRWSLCVEAAPIDPVPGASAPAIAPARADAVPLPVSPEESWPAPVPSVASSPSESSVLGAAVVELRGAEFVVTGWPLERWGTVVGDEIWITGPP
jgi:hypothetical protein